MKLRQNGIVSFLIKLAAFQASGGARVKLHKIRYRFKKYLTAQIAEYAEIIWNFFLGVLCDLGGELLCFFFDQTGRVFLAGGWAEPWTSIWGVLTPVKLTPAAIINTGVNSTILVILIY